MRDGKKNRFRSKGAVMYRLKGADTLEPMMLDRQEGKMSFRQFISRMWNFSLKFCFFSFYTVIFYAGCIGVQDIGAMTLSLEQFKLQKIEIKNNVFVTNETILKEIRLDSHAGFFTCDLSAIKEKIEQIQNVEAVDVLRTVPGFLSIVVYERVPFFRVSGVGCLLDHKGMAVKMKNGAALFSHLTELSGIKLNTDGNVYPADREKYLQIVNLARLFLKHFGKNRFQISKIESGSEWTDFHLLAGPCIRLPYSGKPDIFIKLEKVLNDLHKKETNPSYIDLQFNDVIVRL